MPAKIIEAVAQPPQQCPFCGAQRIGIQDWRIVFSCGTEGRRHQDGRWRCRRRVKCVTRDNANLP